MTPPVVSLAEAVRTHVDPGTTVYVGNFGQHLHCVAAELLRLGADRLHVVAGSGGIMMDQLLGSGLLAEATFGHCWNAVGPTPAWNLRRLAEERRGTVRLHEVTIGVLSAALQAAAWRQPFLPVTLDPGLGYRTHDWTGGMLSTATSDFGTVTVARALAPDVAFVHVDRADSHGNGVLDGHYGDALLAAQSARRTVLVTDELVAPDTAIGPAALPGVLVSAIVVHPGAVRPDGTVRGYARDLTAFRRYAADTATEAGYRGWLARLGVPADGRMPSLGSPGPTDTPGGDGAVRTVG